jgi:hypothetical protein
MASRPKWRIMYDYLTGAGFRHRIEAIVERFTEMHVDLVRNSVIVSASFTRWWALISADGGQAGA